MLLLHMTLLLQIALLELIVCSDAGRCDGISRVEQLQFQLVRACQRSQQPPLQLANVATLEDCVRVAKRARGLALNYAARVNGPRRRQRWPAADVSTTQLVPLNRSILRPAVWQQPQQHFNCHVLDCPQRGHLRDLVRDRRFDYFSLYAATAASARPGNYTCVPQVGLFQLHARTPVTFRCAQQVCANSTVVGTRAALAHVASSARTAALSALLRDHNALARAGGQRKQSLAYVDLHFSRSISSRSLDFRNSDDEQLDCFLYVAWRPGHPRLDGALLNASCVAITTDNAWMTLSCERELPFICEIYTSRGGGDLSDNDAVINDRCAL